MDTSKNPASDANEQNEKLTVKEEAVKILSDQELDQVAGGARSRRATLNPTSTDGCCGG